VEKLSDILPAEILTHAIEESRNITPAVSVEKPPAGDLFSQVENAALTVGVSLTPMEAALKRYPIETFFSGVKVNDRGYGQVNCLFHSPDNESAWFSVPNQLYGCHRCNFKPMTPIGLYAALYTHGDIKDAIREMTR
jgi:hypothetical protein